MLFLCPAPHLLLNWVFFAFRSQTESTRTFYLSVGKMSFWAHLNPSGRPLRVEQAVDLVEGGSAAEFPVWCVTAGWGWGWVPSSDSNIMDVYKERSRAVDLFFWFFFKSRCNYFSFSILLLLPASLISCFSVLYKYGKYEKSLSFPP